MLVLLMMTTLDPNWLINATKTINNFNADVVTNTKLY